MTFELSTNKKYQREDIALSRKWFNEEIAKLSSKSLPDMSDLRQKKGNLDIVPGKMLFYKYDPKFKDVLPYWDMYPLSILLEATSTHMLGLNLHYLPPKLRVLLMTKLMDTLNNHRLDRTTKMKVSYQILLSASKYKLFKPCLHKYIINHVKSKINIIRPAQWPMAVMLPVANFKGASPTAVWADSKQIISGH